MNIDLSGKWNMSFPTGESYPVHLPGTLDTNQLGNEDGKNLDNRFTRVHTYEGPVSFFYTIKPLEMKIGTKRVFFEVERARHLRLKIGGEEVKATICGTLSTPYTYEITEYLNKEEIELEVISDNSYPGWPSFAILNSSAATDETQTNWNGLLGYIRLRVEEQVFIESLLVYPHGKTVDITVVVNAGHSFEGTVQLCSSAFEKEEKMQVRVNSGKKVKFVLSNIALNHKVEKWDEEEGNLYTLTAFLDGAEAKSISFGVRDFGVNDKFRFTINNRVFFLRSEANCAVFPEKGHPPMTEEEWNKVLSVFASYGVNCMRFHSWCPPEAAFIAADKMGMMMQPELSHWNYENAFEDDIDFAYYKEELELTLLYLANHPSFVMLTFGNELWTEELGHKRMDELLEFAHNLDSTRLYANASNAHYGQRGTDAKSDFYTSHDYKEFHLRGASTQMAGHINESYPNAKTNYDIAVKKVHECGQPVFGFEVGQFEVFPDFKEIEQFQGVTRAINYSIIKDKIEKRGQLEHWEEWVDATGEISLIGYREEVEAVLRTEGMSGLSLLGLQDFPGQGTAIVGMLNSHLQPKPYPFAEPARFHKFFAAVVPLLYLDKYTYHNQEIGKAEMRIANYGKQNLVEKAEWRICKEGQILLSGSFESAVYQNEGLRTVGTIEFDLSVIKSASRLDITIQLGEYENSYPIWVYPKFELIGLAEQQDCYFLKGNKEREIKIASCLNRETQEFVELGGCVYLEPQPTKEKMPESIGGQFTTDFWSVGTFPLQEGGMGMVIDTKHPLFRNFPTEHHTNWQWWLMASGRPIILPDSIKPILTVPDSYSRLKHMGLLFEAKIGKGSILVSGMGLRYQQQYPEAAALLHSIMDYMDSAEFEPKQDITAEEINKMILC